jgi:hypothetical protein
MTKALTPKYRSLTNVVSSGLEYVRVLEMAKRRNPIEEHLKNLAECLGPQLVPYINAEDLFRELTLAQRLEGLDADQRLEGLDADQRLEGLSLEDIVNCLSDEKRQALRQLLDDQGTDS